MTDNTLHHLLARCKLRDQQAFKQLYDLTAAKLNGIAYRILLQKEAANDVLQEAFMQIWHNAGDYRADLAEPFTWMASIIRYRAYDKIRNEKRRPHGNLVDEEISDFQFATNDEAAQLVCEIGQQLEDCLNILDKAQQQAILLAYYYGYSRDELASHFHQPLNTVKSWLKRGLARLQLCLEK
jgi:RNA polymerase sigma-70 factor, ECF subfamily